MKKIKSLKLPESITALISEIYESKGRIDLWGEGQEAELEKMCEQGKILLTKSSNGIEGVYTNDSRLQELTNDNALPKNKQEQLIQGYKYALEKIYEQYQKDELTKDFVFDLYDQVYLYTKNENNSPGHRNANWRIKCNIEPKNKSLLSERISAADAEKYLDRLIEGYNRAYQANVMPLLLIPMVTADLYCFNPFGEINPQVTRLIMQYMFLKADFNATRYVPVERIIEQEKSKIFFYTSLEMTAKDWQDNKNNYLPFIKYMLMVINQAYKECENRFKHLAKQKYSVTEKILLAIKQSIKPVAKKDLQMFFADISQRTIERALHELLSNKKIAISGNGRATKYVLAEQEK